MIDAVTARIKDVDELHASLAREFKVHMLAASGPIRREDGKAVNRARLFAPDGSHGHQDKVMLSRFESRGLGAGARDACCGCSRPALGRIGVLIGYDAEFPLLARALAEAGAEVLLVPSSHRRPARLLAGPDRRGGAGAREPVRGGPRGHGRRGRTGCRRRRAAPGAAAVYGPPDVGFPEDGVVAVGKLDAAGWVHAEVPLEAVRKVRTDGTVLTLFDWPRQEGATVRDGGARAVG